MILSRRRRSAGALNTRPGPTPALTHSSTTYSTTWCTRQVWDRGGGTNGQHTGCHEEKGYEGAWQHGLAARCTLRIGLWPRGSHITVSALRVCPSQCPIIAVDGRLYLSVRASSGFTYSYTDLASRLLLLHAHQHCSTRRKNSSFALSGTSHVSHTNQGNQKER